MVYIFLLNKGIPQFCLVDVYMAHRLRLFGWSYFDVTCTILLLINQSFNHFVHTLSTFLRIRAHPSMQIFWISVTVALSDTSFIFFYHPTFSTVPALLQPQGSLRFSSATVSVFLVLLFLVVLAFAFDDDDDDD